MLNASAMIRKFTARRRRAQQVSTRRRSSSAVRTAVMETVEGRRLLSAVSISDAVANEGSNLVFNVTLNAASSAPVTVRYTAAGGTAKFKKDYTGTKAGTLTFAPGETAKQVTLTTVDNNTFTANKTVNVKLSRPSRGDTLADNAAVGTIVNTDAAPVITVTPANARVTEGNRGNAATMSFTITMTGGADKPVKVAYNTVDVSTTSTGKTRDYVPARRTAVFSGKRTSFVVKVRAVGDTTPEANEAFKLNLTQPSNATLGGLGFAVGTIINDDGGAVDNGTTVAITPAVQAAPNATAGITVSLNRISPDPVTVHFATADGTGTAGSDYTATTGDLTFDVGETTKTILVPVDTGATPGETFTVNLSTPAGATIASGASTATIGGTAPALSVNDVTVNESTSAVATATFTVSLSAASAQNVTVHYATADGTAAAADYTAAAGDLTFLPGETSKQVTVNVSPDALTEGNETFSLLLSSAVNASLTDDTGVATIVDAAAPALAISAVYNQGTFSASTLQGAPSRYESYQFTYSITNTGANPITGAQIQFFLVPDTQVNNLANNTPYKTFSIGDIAAGATVTGQLEAGGSTEPTGPAHTFYHFYARLIANGQQLDLASAPDKFFA